MEPADGGGANAPKVKAKPVQWTEAEINALHRALQKHGNRWTLIKQDAEFAALLWRPVGSLQVSLQAMFNECRSVKDPLLLLGDCQGATGW